MMGEKKTNKAKEKEEKKEREFFRKMYFLTAATLPCYRASWPLILPW